MESVSTSGDSLSCHTSVDMFSDEFFQRNTVLSGKRTEEFGRLKDTVYLDHAGATLYAESQLRNYFNDLSSNIYGNPHSGNISSQLTSDLIEQIRYRILRHFNTTHDEYSVIFTSGSTASLKLIADCFQFTNDDDVLNKHGCFVYLTDNHTSVIGMRESLNARNIAVHCVDPSVVRDGLSDSKIECGCQNSCRKESRALFAYPAQSNFSGCRYPLRWINEMKSVKEGHDWFVLLDAASFVTTSRLNLSSVQPDFVPVSFYKMFGFPTGLGALIVRNSTGHLLKKTYFGGGTVEMFLASEMYHVERKSLSSRFEDGTLPFLDILALRHGFDAMEAIGGHIAEISKHTFQLAQFLYKKLKTCYHGNHEPVAKLYFSGDYSCTDAQGGIINFNLLRSDGRYIGFAEVDKLAQAHDIHLRTGCFCNLGACQKALGLTNQQLRDNLKAGHVCGDDLDLINGHPTGSVRVSLGYMSTLQDAICFINFIEACFVEGRQPHIYQLHGNQLSKSCLGRRCQLTNNNYITLRSTATLDAGENGCHADEGNVNGLRWNDGGPSPETGSRGQLGSDDKSLVNSGVSPYAVHTSLATDEGLIKLPSPLNPKLTRIFIYPVKSCGSFEVTQWKVGERGLLHDREWMVTSPSGACLRDPHLTLIKPVIDLKRSLLILNYKELEPLEVPLNSEETDDTSSANMCQGKVCGVRIKVRDSGAVASRWLQRALDKPGLRLVSQSSLDNRVSRRSQEVKLSLANQSQYLLITTGSVEALQRHMIHKGCTSPMSVDDLTLRLRPNLVVALDTPFLEDSFESLAIGKEEFYNQGACDRCKMVCYDPVTAAKSSEPLTSLASLRNHKSQFGILLRRVDDTADSIELRVGQDLTFTTSASSTPQQGIEK